MNFKEYQDKAWTTAIYPDKGNNIIYGTLGLVGESGELANKVKKIQRDDNRFLTPEKRLQIIDELGDVLWYCAALATELNTDLESIAIRNINKLSSRNERNKISGEGDVR